MSDPGETGAPVTVLGAGALGLLLAALLREGGADARLLDHDVARAARLVARGVAVRGLGGERVVRVPASATELPTAGLLLVCVKASADSSVARRLADLKGCVTVVTLGNGLGRGEALESLGADRILFGTTLEGATLEGEGRVRHAGRGRTRIAPLRPAGAARAAKAVRVLGSHGLDVALESDAARLAWEKLVVNAAINALTGLLQAPNGALLEVLSARDLADRAAVEAAAVARARGVAGDWSPERARERWREVARATARNLSSTAQDLARARTSEVHAINGAIARAAREAGLEAPVNELLAALVAAREELSRGNASPGSLTAPGL